MLTVVNNPYELKKQILGLKKGIVPRNNIKEILDKSVVFNFLKKMKKSKDIFAKERVSQFSAVVGGTDNKISVIESYAKKNTDRYIVTSEFDGYTGDLLKKTLPNGTIIKNHREGSLQARTVYQEINGAETLKIVQKGEPIYIVEKDGEIVSEYVKSAHLNKSVIKTSSSHFLTADKRDMKTAEGFYTPYKVLENRVTLKDGREFVRSFNGSDSTLIVSDKNHQVLETVIGGERIKKYIKNLPQEAQEALNTHLNVK